MWGKNTQKLLVERILLSIINYPLHSIKEMDQRKTPTDIYFIEIYALYLNIPHTPVPYSASNKEEYIRYFSKISKIWTSIIIFSKI